MDSVLAIGPKVHGFKPGRDNGFLKATKICSTPYFRVEVKPQATCCKHFMAVKDLYKYERNIS
jgi:hypothetical protein